MVERYYFVDPKIKNTGYGSINMWCGKHTYFDDQGNEIKEDIYIDPKIRNTGYGSMNLWCGKHTYFDDEGNEIKEDIYIHPNIRNTGYSSLNLWCGKHTYFDEQDTRDVDSEREFSYDPYQKDKHTFSIEKMQTKKIVHDLTNGKDIIIFEDKDIYDLT